MSLPMTPVFCLIAIVPVLFLLTAIMKFGWGVARAAPIGMLLAGGIAVLCFNASPLALTVEAGKGKLYSQARSMQDPLAGFSFPDSSGEDGISNDDEDTTTGDF